MNASDVARDTGLASNHRVNDRINDLTVNFLTWRCPQRVGGQPSETAQRKVYFADPLLARLESIVDDQRSAPDASRIAEQQLGLSLTRAIDTRVPDAFALGTRVMYERTKTGKEIDFVSPDFAGCFEGKYVDRGWKRESLTARANYENGVLATRRIHDLSERIWATPAPSLAWLLDPGD